MIPPVSAASETAAPTGREPATADPQLKKATLGFERVLLTQLLAPLAEAAGEDAPAAYKEMLPQALADAVVDGGGIGLAADLQRALKEQSR
jgi:hypothetical protein